MTVIAERYELLEPLGSGGMARVVTAYDRRLQRRVAIKLVRDDLLAEPSSRERLLREARAAAGLAHPNTVAVHDVGEDDGRPFIVMELVEGPTLADRLRAEGRLSVEDTVAVGSALLDGLQAAHARGLVHRDVKPSNVLLPVGGGVKLADFGIAKALEATTAGLTASGQVLGTPRYLAPEVAAGADATPASDLYAVGVVLFECLTGRAPFDRPSPVAVALAHQREHPPDLRDVAPHVPAWVAATVERALAKQPEQRFANAAEMRAGLHGAAPVAMPVRVPHDAADAPPTTPLVPAGADDATSPLQADEASGTRPLATAPPASERQSDRPAAAVRPRGRRTALVAGLLAAAAVALLAATALLRPGGEPTATPADDAAGPATDDAGGGPAAPDPPAGGGDGAGPAEEPGGGPETLDDLIAELARDPDAAGRRGDRLLDELRKVRDEDPGDKQPERARKLVQDVASWLADDELDAAAGLQALAILEPLVQPDRAELTDVGALFAEVAADKRAWGEKGEDLLDDLADLLGEDDAEDRAEDAVDLIEEIDAWIADDELDHDRGRHAQDTLRPLADDAR